MMKKLFNNRWVYGILVPLTLLLGTCGGGLFFGLQTYPIFARLYCFGKAYISPFEVKILVTMGMWACLNISLFVCMAVALLEKRSEEVAE